MNHSARSRPVSSLVGFQYPCFAEMLSICFSTSVRNCDTARENSAVRAGASPSQKGMPGGWPCASSTRTVPELISGDFPRRVAELKNIARHAFDGEIFVDRADECFARFHHHAVIAVVRNRAAGGQRQQARAAPPADAMVHGIVMNAAPRAGRVWC